ncbi:MAG: large conductance mechanosensitive channel protein MscL [Clostridiales bacterium]|nr:large conductance mechanosensitive channel protein MscL [Clostridiales bacterium]
MKKFFGEFKKFITRGNVLDMAVGVIVGGAFTAIVNGVSNFILKPIINWVLALILGGEGLSGAITFLSKGYATDGTIDLANSIYIDWGAFISAVINFFLIALVLFTIVKIMNEIKENNEEIKEKIKKKKLTKEDKKELKAKGIKRSDKKAVEAYLAEKKAEADAKLEQEKLEAEEKAKQERLANPTTEDLLKKLIEIMENK